jgi:hypothetical protein
MKLWKLECYDQYGHHEDNGYFLNKENAKKAKKEHDNMPMNKRYGIKQHIIEIETED